MGSFFIVNINHHTSNFPEPVYLLVFRFYNKMWFFFLLVSIITLVTFQNRCIFLFVWLILIDADEEEASAAEAFLRQSVLCSLIGLKIEWLIGSKIKN